MTSFVLITSCAIKTGEVFGQDKDEVEKIRKIISEEQYIIHACGIISGSDGIDYTYTNSFDALQNCYRRGNRISEIDFRISSDNCLVCTHEWTMMYKNGIALPNIPITKNEFLLCKTYGGFKSMWLGDLVDFLYLHNDFYFVTDIKDENIEACKLLADYCPQYLDHFIIQIYKANEYEQIRKLGFRNIIWTLYRLDDPDRKIEDLIEFANNHLLVGYTYWYYWTDLYLDSFLQAKIPSFIHTINDEEDQKTYFTQGVTAIYTDNVNN